MTQGKENFVEKEVRVKAKPETIFPFLVEEEKLLQWKGVEAELDPRPGGIYRCNVTGKNIARGQFLEIVPNEKVVFSWGWEEEGSAVPPGSSKVEIILIPDGDATIVRLRHYDLPVSEQSAHEEGWTHFLERLAIVGEGRHPGPDPWVSV